MGLGKTHLASEKIVQFKSTKTIVICQKSKLDDWCEHFKEHYPHLTSIIYKKPMTTIPDNTVVIINYDSVWRKPEFAQFTGYNLILDESQYIKNATAKRSKFVLKMKFDNIILLSGTPVAGKYEELLTQCHLLGWKITKDLYWKTFINYRVQEFGGIPLKIVTGYKNIDLLKKKLGEVGAVFMKSEDVITLPEQVEITVPICSTKAYKTFLKDRIVVVETKELVGATSLTNMLYQRQLTSQYNDNKLDALRDLIESTEDRLIIFYNFTEEFNQIVDMCKRKVSYVNGAGRDLTGYENDPSSITLIQYQAGASGLNLQKANKIIYFSLPLSADLYMQSMKRTHRIGQTKTCFYYYMITKGTIEEKILKVLKMREDYTQILFDKDFK